MSLLSPCDGSSRRAVQIPTAKPGVGTASGKRSLRVAIVTFLEELGILFRYAAGLDYYGGLVSGKH